jgi:hypothetical protein
MGYGDASRWIHPWVLNEEQSRPMAYVPHPVVGPQ